VFRLYFDSAVTEEALDEHDGIIDAIELSDSRAARSEMKDHLSRSHRHLRSAFD